MSEKNERGQGGEVETQQALLRYTIDRSSEMIAQADRLISASRRRPSDTPTNDRHD
jgi:hypothetical protein